MKRNADKILPASLPGPDTMEVNPLTLSFSEHLESVFLAEYYRKSLRLVRLSLLAGIMIYALFGILDEILLPNMKETLWFIRFAIVCPFLLLVIVFSYFSLFQKFFQFAVSLAMAVSGLAIISMISIIPSPVNYSYYAGLILVFIWGYTFTRVRFVWATAAGWIIVAVYEVVAIWISDTPHEVLVSNNFFFISANLAGMISCYYIEYFSRRDFFLAHLLEQKQETIIAANQTLEKIVLERTFELREINHSLRQEIDERKRSEEKREELEKQLQQVQKMEAIGTLAGGIAHDFNNLLMGILGHISILLIDGDLSHDQEEKIKNIRRYVLLGSDLTKQLLGFARGGKYEVKPTNLNELILKSSRLFGRTKKEITINTSLDEDIGIVEVDQGQIEQVLLNLYVNAWQAMPGGGILTLESKKLTLLDAEAHRIGLPPGSYSCISVKDSGIGMDEHTRRRVFEPFFTTKAMGRGTGLGLASAYGIIKSHGGIIEVISALGKGTEFKIFFPASDKQYMNEVSAPLEIKMGTETILLIDDEDMVIETSKDLLEKLGHNVFIAMNGKDAVDIFKQRKDEIELIILDMIMPGMSGSTTFNSIKEIKKEIKVLLSSGYSISKEARQLLDRGCNGFLQKPYDIYTLSNKIREIMDNNNSGNNIEDVNNGVYNNEY